MIGLYIGLYIVVSLVAIEIAILFFMKRVWLMAGIFASLFLGVLSLIFLVLSAMRGYAENFALDSFFISQMLLPILFSLEIHYVAGIVSKKRPKKK